MFAGGSAAAAAAPAHAEATSVCCWWAAAASEPAASFPPGVPRPLLLPPSPPRGSAAAAAAPAGAQRGRWRCRGLPHAGGAAAAAGGAGPPAVLVRLRVTDLLRPGRCHHPLLLLQLCQRHQVMPNAAAGCLMLVQMHACYGGLRGCVAAPAPCRARRHVSALLNTCRAAKWAAGVVGGRKQAGSSGGQLERLSGHLPQHRVWDMQQ